MLIPYAGRRDEAYAAKLAGRLRELATHPNRLADGAALRSKAEKFSYPRIAVTAAEFIDSVLHARQR
jgi:hypothetical protein